MDVGKQKNTKSIVSKKSPVPTSTLKKSRCGESKKTTTSQEQSSQKEEKKKVHFSPSVESTPLLVKKKSKESSKVATPTVNKGDRKRTTIGEVQSKKTKQDVELDRMLKMEEKIGELSTDITRILISSENIIHTSASCVSDVASCMTGKLEILRDVSHKLDDVDTETQNSLDAINIADLEDEMDNCLTTLKNVRIFKVDSPVISSLTSTVIWMIFYPFWMMWKDRETYYRPVALNCLLYSE